MIIIRRYRCVLYCLGVGLNNVVVCMYVRGYHRTKRDDIIILKNQIVLYGNFKVDSLWGSVTRRGKPILLFEKMRLLPLICILCACVLHNLSACYVQC